MVAERERHPPRPRGGGDWCVARGGSPGPQGGDEQGPAAPAHASRCGLPYARTRVVLCAWRCGASWRPRVLGVPGQVAVWVSIPHDARRPAHPSGLGVCRLARLAACRARSLGHVRCHTPCVVCCQGLSQAVRVAVPAWPCRMVSGAPWPPHGVRGRSWGARRSRSTRPAPGVCRVARTPVRRWSRPPWLWWRARTRQHRGVVILPGREAYGDRHTGGWHHLGILPGCGAHLAQTPSLGAGPGQEGRQTRGHPEGTVSCPCGP